MPECGMSRQVLICNDIPPIHRYPSPQTGGRAKKYLTNRDTINKVVLLGDERT